MPWAHSENYRGPHEVQLRGVKERVIPLNLQQFAADPTDPEPDPGQDPSEPQPVPLELPSAEPQDLQTSAQQATAAAVEAIAQVKQIEIQGLAAVIDTLNQLVTELRSLIQQATENLQATENFRLEALELTEALKEVEQEEHEEAHEPASDLLPSPSRPTFLSNLKKIL